MYIDTPLQTKTSTVRPMDRTFNKFIDELSIDRDHRAESLIARRSRALGL
jgi:hypothetical protein